MERSWLQVPYGASGLRVHVVLQRHLPLVPKEFPQRHFPWIKYIDEFN